MNLAAVSVKAFGDFLIAFRAIASAVEQAPHRKLSIIASPHLRPLADALGGGSTLVKWMGGHSQGDVPAAFDISRKGVVNAAQSLVMLRRELQRMVNTDQTLVFDRLGFRERFMAGRVPVTSLAGQTANIYSDYEELLRFRFPHALDSLICPQPIGSQAFIVPASRIARKVMPAHVIDAAHRVLRARGVDAQVLLLEGENVELPSGVRVHRIERQFSALIAALKEVDLVISADSLAAHLGEHVMRPTFVFSPVDNQYWLPRAAFDHGGAAVFADPSTFERWVSWQLARGEGAVL